MKGFLLTRVVQPHNSSCLTHHSTLGTCPDQEHCAAGSLMDNLYDASRTCLPQRAKVVLLVVDALRHDFAAYDPDNKAPLAYQNKLTVIRDALRARPDQSRLYRFVADPPTTTMQRLKALTTGSLPTFIDAGANFATPEINEDNLIDQVSARCLVL